MAYPRRSLARLPSDEPPPRAGNWKTAKLKETKRRLRRISATKPKAPGRDPYFDGLEHPEVLNVGSLLRFCGGSDPADVTTARISGQELETVERESAEEFVSLVHVNASDNSLQLETLSFFPALQVLELALNNIQYVTLEPFMFPHLAVLDLSYNNLCGDAIAALRVLPKLRALDLSGNGLKALPLDLCAPYEIPNERNANEPPEIRQGFQCLETLIMDHNRFRGPKVFQATAGLPRIQYLSLNFNCLQFIPELVSDDESLPPFPYLQVLSLTHNRIATPADVLAVKSWPQIHELTIVENPLSRASRNLPAELQDMCDEKEMNIQRHPVKPQKPSASAAPNNVVRVDTSLPPIPRKRNDKLSNTLPSKPEPKYLTYKTTRRPATSPLPPIASSQHPDSDGSDTDNQTESVSEMSDNGEREDPEPSQGAFFLTQTDDVEDPTIEEDEQDVNDEQKESTIITSRPVTSQLPPRPKPKIVGARNPFATTKTHKRKKPKAPVFSSSAHATMEAMKLLGIKPTESPKSTSKALALTSKDLQEGTLPTRYKGFEELVINDDKDAEEEEEEDLPQNIQMATRALKYALANPLRFGVQPSSNTKRDEAKGRDHKDRRPRSLGNTQLKTQKNKRNHFVELQGMIETMKTRSKKTALLALPPPVQENEVLGGGGETRKELPVI